MSREARRRYLAWIVGPVAVLVGLPAPLAHAAAYPRTPEDAVASFAVAVGARNQHEAMRYIITRGPGPDAYTEFGKPAFYQLVDPECTVVSHRVEMCTFYYQEPSRQALLRKVNGRWRVAAILGENADGITDFPPDCAVHQAPARRVEVAKPTWLVAKASGTATAVVRLRVGEQGAACVTGGDAGLRIPIRIRGLIGYVARDAVQTGQ